MGFFGFGSERNNTPDDVLKLIKEYDYNARPSTPYEAVQMEKFAAQMIKNNWMNCGKIARHAIRCGISVAALAASAGLSEEEVRIRIGINKAPPKSTYEPDDDRGDW